VEAADRRHAQEPPVLDRKLRESSSPSPSSQGTAYRLFTFPGSHRLEDYAALLSVKNKHIPFFAPNQPVPVLLALILGLQHALAMVRPPLSLYILAEASAHVPHTRTQMGGLVVPPILLGGAAGAGLSSADQIYLVSACLIWCGLGTLLQVSRIPIGKGYYIGSGVLVRPVLLLVLLLLLPSLS